MDSINKKKEKVPDRFKDKSEDDILKMLDEADKAAGRITELEAERVKDTDKVKAIETEFETVKARLAAAEANRNPNPKPGDNNNEELANFVEDPDKAFSQRIGPVANIAVQTAAMTARMLAQQQLNNADMASNSKTMDGRLFQHWGAEIDAEAKKYQTVQLTTPQAWLGIYMYLKGVHADELRDPEIRKKKYNFMEPASSSTNQNGDNTPKPAADQLTDAEKHVADKMGVKHEDYLKRKKAMQFVNA
jgi:hypothetical protein